jgi:hypothetical protein
MQNPQKIKTGSNPAEFYKEGYGSKSAVLPMIMMMKLLALCSTSARVRLTDFQTMNNLFSVPSHANTHPFSRSVVMQQLHPIG